jgi:nucleoside-diphosphate-sugar epimerase
VRVLVVGAGGFLGRSAVLACVKAGIEVRGMVRNPAQAAIVTASGGEPFLGDVAVPADVEKAVIGCDALLHLACPSTGESSDAEARRELERSRVQGARNLVAAAEAEGVPRLIIGSGYWVYGDQPHLITEDSSPHPPAIVAHNWGAEQVGRAAHRPGVLDVVIVRPSMVYGNGAWFRPMLDAIRAGTYRYVGDGSNRWSPLAWEDCGQAFRVILRNGKGGETYLVADDGPVAIRTFAEFVAAEVGAPVPQGIAFEEAVRTMGVEVATALRANQAASNAKLRSLGWQPKYPTYRDGLPGTIREILAA